VPDGEKSVSKRVVGVVFEHAFHKIPGMFAIPRFHRFASRERPGFQGQCNRKLQSAFDMLGLNGKR